MSLPYVIEYTVEAKSHLEALTARQKATLLDTAERQLTHQPTVETRNRKRLRPNPLWTWELRAGELRLYYDVSEAPRIVTVRAVGLKDRNQVRIGKRQVGDEGL